MCLIRNSWALTLDACCEHLLCASGADCTLPPTAVANRRSASRLIEKLFNPMTLPFWCAASCIGHAAVIKTVRGSEAWMTDRLEAARNSSVRRCLSSEIYLLGCNFSL